MLIIPQFIMSLIPNKKAVFFRSFIHNVAHWSELTVAMNWIHQAVTILDNEEHLPVSFVQQRFGAWMIFF